MKLTARRLLSTLLVLCMVFAMLPMGVFAANGDAASGTIIFNVEDEDGNPVDISMAVMEYDWSTGARTEYDTVDVENGTGSISVSTEIGAKFDCDPTGSTYYWDTDAGVVRTLGSGTRGASRTNTTNPHHVAIVDDAEFSIVFDCVVTYQGTTYKVSYEFESADSTELPSTGMPEVPADVDGLNPGATVTTSPIDYEDVEVEGGVWSFKGWDKRSVTVGSRDVVVTGTWAFTPETYTVTYLYDTTKEAPSAPPVDGREYEAGDSVTVPDMEDETVGDYTYVFQGWSRDNVAVTTGKFTMPAKDVTLTGWWTKKEAEQPEQPTPSPEVTPTPSPDVTPDTPVALTGTVTIVVTNKATDEGVSGVKFDIYAYADGQSAPVQRTKLGTVTTDSNGEATYNVVEDDEVYAGYLIDCDPVGDLYDWGDLDGVRTVSGLVNATKGSNPNEVIKVTGDDFAGTMNCKITRTEVKTTPTVTIGDASKAYDGDPAEADITITGENGEAITTNYTVQYFDGEDVIYTYTIDPQWNPTGYASGKLPVDAGTYKVGVYYKGSDDYNAVAWTENTFTISKATPTVTIGDAGKVYDGKAAEATVTITGAKGEALTTNYDIQYFKGSESTAMYTYTINPQWNPAGYATGTLPVDVGSYKVGVYFKGADNYAPVAWAEKLFNITPYTIKDAEVGCTASEEYNGEAQYAGVHVDVTLDGVVTRLIKDKDFTVQYTQDDVEINPTQPGTYDVTVKGIGNYTGTVVKQFEIKPAAVNVTYAFTPATGLPAGVTDQLPAATVIYTGDAVELPNMTKVDVKGGAWYFEGWTVTGAEGDYKEYTVGTTDVPVTGAWKFYPGDISIEITKNIKVEAPEKPDKPEKPGKPTRPEIDKDHWRISFIDKNELGYNANPASDNYWGWDKKFDDKRPEGGKPDGKPEIIRPTIRETFTFKLYTVETNRFGKVVKTDLLQTITFYYDAKALTQTREFVLNAKAEAALKDGKNVFIAEVDNGDSSWDYDNAVYVLSYADGEVKAKRSVTGAVDLSLNYVDVEFTNEYLGEEEDEDDYEDGAVVKLTLVDAKDEDEVISGAKFYLYKEGRNSDVKIGGTYYTTSVKGQIIVRGLDEGDYYFVQSTTKTGYEKVEERIEFEVEDEDDYIKITVENAKEGCPSEYFYDLNTGMWYHEAVDFVLDKGLMNGVGGKYFDPHGTINRAMVVTILWRLEGQPYVAGNMSFKDVGSGLWYTEAVRWAAANDIVTGHDAATFAPLESITHEQMAAILYRYAQFEGKSVNTAAGAGVMNFSDANQISAWALDAMKWAYGEGIVGYMGTTLDPKDPAQRCEAAKMLMEYLK